MGRDVGGAELERLLEIVKGWAHRSLIVLQRAKVGVSQIFESPWAKTERKSDDVDCKFVVGVALRRERLIRRPRRCKERLLG
jgi:hypothetical protein